MPLSVVNRIKAIGSKHIVVLYGGDSTERNISLASGNGVIQALIELDYAVTTIDVGTDISKILSLLSPVPDVIFNCLHGKYGEDGSISGLLNIIGVPYTHSGVGGSAIGFDKSLAHWVYIANNICVPETKMIFKGSKITKDPMPRPYVIKPVDQGSSIGVHVIRPETDFNFADYDFPYGNKVLVQKFIPGRELNIAVLNGKCLPGILEIQFSGTKSWFDYDAKYTPGYVKHSIPPNPDLGTSLTQQIYDISEKVYSILGCRGLCRVEVIVEDSSESIFLLEINTHPGLTQMSICPEIAGFCGMSYQDLVREIINVAAID